MSRKENIEKNMEFLIKELQKEWDVSKETKHRVTISVKDARRIRIRVQQQIADMGEMLHNQSDMSFKESMKLCRANYVTLRVARKLIAGQNAAEAAGEAEYTVAFDKEEFSCFRKLATE
jgi:hypothetical protein